MKWRRFGTAAVVALIFAEGDSASDSGDSGGSDSGDSASSGSELSGSDSGDSADIGLFVTNLANVSSSGDGTPGNTGSSDTSDSESPSSDNSSNRSQQRPSGQPGVTEGMSVGDLKDIPFKGDDGPIKR